jgi:glucuronate isomerase
MRANGVAEKYCTGGASDWEKFEAWAATVPKTLRNPLYHWTHMELNDPFEINDRRLNPETAKGIWDECNEMLQEPIFSARGIMKQMNVVLVCTTDDPRIRWSTTRPLQTIHRSTFAVLPAWRPDKGMAVERVDAFNEWLDRLGAAANVDIQSFSDYRTRCKPGNTRFTKPVAGSPITASTRCTMTGTRNAKSNPSSTRCVPADRLAPWISASLSPRCCTNSA